MKSKIHLLRLAIVCFLLYTTTLYAQWNYVGPPGISKDWVTKDQIAIDQNGFPVVAYEERSSNGPNILQCKKHNGSSWESVDSVSLHSFPVAQFEGFMIGKNNEYFIFFIDTGGYKPSCIRYDGKSWKYAGSKNILDHNATISFALDSNDVPYVAAMGGQGFKLLKENGATWELLPTTGMTPSPVGMSLAFDKSNTLHLSCGDFDPTFKGIVSCMKLNNATWQKVGSTIYTQYLSTNTRLHFTAQGALYVALDDQLIFVKKFNASTNSWDAVGNSGLDNGHRMSTEGFVSDSAGNLYISTSSIAGDHARCIQFDGKGWNQLGVSGISDTTAGNTPIAIDNRHHALYVSYNDFELEKLVVKRLDLLISGLRPCASSHLFSVYPNPATSTLTLTYDAAEPGIGNYKLRNITGAVMVAGTFAEHQSENTINVEHLSPGCYLVEITTASSRYTYKVMKQ
jgi:hypothetical protein